MAREGASFRARRGVLMEAIARPDDLYSASQAAFSESRFDGEPDWVASLRRDAMASFAKTGFPTAKDEAWRYTNPAPIVRTPFGPAEEAEPGRVEAIPIPGGEGARLVFVNGAFSAELSRGAFGPATAISLRRALAGEGAVQPRLGRIASRARQSFTALNTAFFGDGAFVRIPRGTVLEEPIHIVFVAVPGAGPGVSHPRNLILAGAESQARVIETYIGSGGSDGSAPTLTNAVTEISCGEGAILEHTKLQRESVSAFHVHRIAVEQGRASRFDSHNLCFGGSLARTDIDVLFQAEGCECALNGLFVTQGSQHVDNHTLIDHAKPHCTSRELYKGILAGKSRGVFHGKVIVRPDAQKTDAIQTNKNLLLSREALVNSTPALEILADDVKCKHGSTIGQLDANALFYLRARGIGEEDAKAMLTYGFAADLASRLTVPWVREEVEAFLGGRLVRATEAA
ncbi:MAG TPA: Fe-S cluster assembly protein SufD [Thermoanaerobaculia bacterium]|nr:Fe-S cluster assembly protein SufD [Thermoanaerobaculia bacterium]